MERLSVVDSAFITFESDVSPMHVASLLVFEQPTGGGKYCYDLYNKMRKYREAAYPFNQKVNTRRLNLPNWEKAEDFDINEHLFYHKLPSPGNRNQLHELISGLHEGVMRRERPLWEYHLISGLKKSRFAVYIKLHHAYADGVTLSSWIARSLSEARSNKDLKPLWTIAYGERKSRPTGEFNLIDAGKQLLDRQLKGYRMVKGLTRIGSQLALEKMNLTHNAISFPFSAPDTLLNRPLSRDRQLATASVPMERVNRIRKAARVSLNQVAISCIDEALHRYLSELGEPLDEPLIISMPVSLRRRGANTPDRGNQVCMVLVKLANKTDDPYIRLRDVGMKLRHVRYQVDEMPAQAMTGYSMILGVTALGLESVGISRAISPMSNLIISNVPGPPFTLYLQGAKLLEQYPVSTIPKSHQLNITLYSYDQNLHFGLIATKSLKNLANLGSYIYEAFKHLESSVLDPLNEQELKMSEEKVTS